MHGSAAVRWLNFRYFLASSDAAYNKINLMLISLLLLLLCVHICCLLQLHCSITRADCTLNKPQQTAKIAVIRREKN